MNKQKETDEDNEGCNDKEFDTEQLSETTYEESLQQEENYFGGRTKCVDAPHITNNMKRNREQTDDNSQSIDEISVNVDTETYVMEPRKKKNRARITRNYLLDVRSLILRHRVCSGRRAFKLLLGQNINLH